MKQATGVEFPFTAAISETVVRSLEGPHRSQDDRCFGRFPDAELLIRGIEKYVVEFC